MGARTLLCQTVTSLSLSYFSFFFFTLLFCQCLFFQVFPSMCNTLSHSLPCCVTGVLSTVNIRYWTAPASMPAFPYLRLFPLEGICVKQSWAGKIQAGLGQLIQYTQHVMTYLRYCRGLSTVWYSSTAAQLLHLRRSSRTFPLSNLTDLHWIFTVAR